MKNKDHVSHVLNVTVKKFGGIYSSWEVQVTVQVKLLTGRDCVTSGGVVSIKPEVGVVKMFFDSFEKRI